MTERSSREAEPGRRIKVGISSCLLGAAVRYDGGHKRDRYLADTLSRSVEYVPFCPEVAIGLGTPRAPIQLVRTRAGVRVLGVDRPERDVTEAIERLAHEQARGLGSLSGYVWKSGSPSCAMARVKVYSEAGTPAGTGAGAFAGTLMSELPLLPCEEEGRLRDPALRENFLQRVFTYHRWQGLLAEGLTPERLVAFHTEHEFLILAHDEVIYRELGRLVAGAGRGDLAALAGRYAADLMRALARPASAKRHANVLAHLLGFVSDRLDAGDRAEMVHLIDEYRRGHLPRIVPLALLGHHFKRHPSPHVGYQRYLAPLPVEFP